MAAVRTSRTREAEARKALARKTINFLCSMKGANTTVTTATFRSMLLQTDGWVLFNGKRYEIKGKSLGAGVYRVSLEEA